MSAVITHVVSVSGGKDSTATLLLALEQHDRSSVRAVFADTGNEHELTLEYVDYLSGRLEFPIVTVRADFTADLARLRGSLATIADGGQVPRFRWTAKEAARALPFIEPTGNPYLDLCILKGRFPSRRAQFCTERLKRDPLIEFQMAIIDREGSDVWSWQGIRADESPRRRFAQNFEEVGGGLWINRPILRWTAADTFEAMAACGVKPNPLYLQGMSRVGCMPCINASKEEISAIAHRFPDHVERIRHWESIVAGASKRAGATFFPAPDKDSRGDRQGRGIVAVVQWARTARGGLQLDLMKSVAGPACSSAYGLCE